jgi:hypothetical protein
LTNCQFFGAIRYFLAFCDIILTMFQNLSSFLA